MSLTLPLHAMPGLFGMAKLSPVAPVPDAALLASPCFIARTAHELSLIAPLEVVESIGPSAGRFRLLCIALTFGTTESGVLRRIADPLADAGLWILAVGTHDTDYILLREDQFLAGIAALEGAGHQITFS